MYSTANIHRKAYVIWKELLLFFFSFLTSPGFSQDYNFLNFNSEDGLAQSYIYSIIQDARGYLWVGTGNGLSRYNGFVFENYTTNDSLAGNFITCGIRDGESLWFGHMNGRLSYYNGKKFHSLNIPETNLSHITHLAKSPDGVIWASTYADGILNLGKEPGVIKHNLFKDQVFIISFDFLDDNKLLVSTNTGLLYCRLKDPGEIEIIRTVAEIPESKITCIQKMRNKSGFFIATENEGIFQLTYKDNILKVTKIMTDNNSVLTGIQDICEDSQSDLWLSTFGKGIIKIIFSASGEPKKIEYLNKANGFTAVNVKTTYEDSEGNIWTGNYGEGLTQITPKTFSVYTFDKHLYGNNIFSICFDQQYWWIGTENGLVKTDRLNGKIIKFYSKGTGLPKDSVTAIYSNNGKELWIGTEKNGVFRMESANEKISKYPFGKGTLENSITSIAGKGEQVWIGTKKGLCNINSVTNRQKWYTINQGGLPYNFVNYLYIDNKDRLWITTRSNILAYMQDEIIKKIPLFSGSGNFTLGPVTQDTDSLIWVGSNGKGTFLIRSDSIINLTVQEGLLSNYCYSLICDDQRNIWVGHIGGLSRIRTSDFLVKPIQHIEGITDGYRFNSNATAKDQQERIWFGSDKGMVSYDPSMEYARSPAPVLGITSIRINDEEIENTDNIILSPGNYKIRIDFLGISLKEPALVNYQHKLEGYDQWSEITKNTSITYNHLTEGVYTFILKASSGDGTVTENPLTINIIIKKPVWKKWWFYFAMGLILFMLTFFYIKRREYKFQVEKKILEEKVRERTIEIEYQKNEIELQRDMIDKKNIRITSSIRYARHIQNAVLPPIELIDRLLPDSFIFSKPKDIVSGDFFWLAEKDNKIVFTVADCTGHGVPGAFMSILGITLLNDIVNVQEITRSDIIVTKLRENIIHSLQQKRKETIASDGLDIALCVLDKKQKRIQYTGGKNDLVYIRDGKLEVIKADNFSVSIIYEDSGDYTMKEIDCKKGDIYYLFSDGYKDQFGGAYDKKYMARRFYDTLLEIHELPMISQKEILKKKLYEWMKDGSQTDDITVMGVRIS